MAFKVFLATRKGETEERLAEYEKAVWAIAEKEKLSVVVTHARAYYEERFKIAGGWPNWITEVAREFDLILVCTEGTLVGRATADLVKKKHALGGRVALLPYGTWTIKPIVAVEHFTGSEFEVFVQNEP